MEQKTADQEMNIFFFYLDKYKNELNLYSSSIDSVLDYIMKLTKLISGVILTGRGDPTPLETDEYPDLFLDFIDIARISLMLSYAYGMEFANVFQNSPQKIDQELNLEYSVNPYRPMLF